MIFLSGAKENVDRAEMMIMDFVRERAGDPLKPIRRCETYGFSHDIL